MKDIHTIFDELGGSGKVAEFLEVKPSAASEMKRRKSVPVKYWAKLVFACQEKGIEGVSYDALVSAHSEKANAA